MQFLIWNKFNYDVTLLSFVGLPIILFLLSLTLMQGCLLSKNHFLQDIGCRYCTLNRCGSSVLQFHAKHFFFLYIAILSILISCISSYSYSPAKIIVFTKMCCGKLPFYLSFVFLSKQNPYAAKNCMTLSFLS